jgi:hypothetical protein
MNMNKLQRQQLNTKYNRKHTTRQPRHNGEVSYCMKQRQRDNLKLEREGWK